ncbi:MAG: Flp family type IVb pilin [Bacillota bacterium]
MLSIAINVLTDENGQGIVEYALIMAFMVLVCVAGYTALGPIIRERIDSFCHDAY